MKRTFTLFLCIFCLAFLVLSPSIIVGGVHKNTYTIREQKKTEQYKGSLTIWHIVSFKTGGASGASFLRDRISGYERNHPYVFIDLIPLTPDEAQAKLQNGEFPDLLSFPLGFWGDTRKISTLPEEKTLLPAYAACGDNGSVYAYPYMADSYVLSCNQDLFSSGEVPVPLTTGISRENFVAALQKLSLETNKGSISPLSLSKTAGLHPAAALLYLKTIPNEDDLFDEELPVDRPLGSFPISYDGGADAFLDGKAAMLLSPSSEYEQMANDKRANSMSISAYSISRYSDMVQMIAVGETEDIAKYDMCLGFAQLLLAPDSQKKLEEMKMLPVTQVDGIFEGQTLQMEEYRSLGSEGMIPNNFSLYSVKDGLDELLKKALSGNTSYKEQAAGMLFN